jgi:hypothetical protein
MLSRSAEEFGVSLQFVREAEFAEALASSPLAQ